MFTSLSSTKDIFCRPIQNTNSEIFNNGHQIKKNRSVSYLTKLQNDTQNKAIV